MLKKLLSCFFIFAFSASASFAQTTKGKDFWLGFMYNLIDDAPLEIYVTAERNVTGTATIPGLGWSQSFSVPANSSVLITVPNTTAGAMANNASDVVEAKAVHIVTCDTVSVYAINKGAYSDDAAVIYPTLALGNYYRALNINGNPGDWGKEFLIVATANNTQVQINPTVATGGGHAAGTPYTITLNQGDMYQVQSQSDLTGTTITGIASGGQSCQNFAVFSGSTCLNIGGCVACDHIYEQLAPVKQWGKNFCGGLFATKAGLIFRVLADQNGTSFTINNGAPISLSAGQYYEYSGSGSINDYSIISNQPVAVMQYMMGEGCDANGMGDPDHVLISPIEQTMNVATFYTIPSSVVTAFYANVLTKTSAIGNITLNGAPIPPASFTPISANPQYSYARGIVLSQSTNYQLKSDSGFSAFVYGLGNAESYTYPVGTSVRDLLSDFTIQSTANPPCPGTLINFTAINDPNATSYSWDFGDGTSGNGLTTSHTYGAIGTYVVTLTKNIPGSCGIQVQKTVAVLGPQIKIQGNDTICPHQSTTLTVPIGTDTISYTQTTLCGGTIVTQVVSTTDSVIWSTGDTGSVIHVSPNTTTTYYAWGYVRGSNCFATDSITIYVVHPTAAFTAPSSCPGVSTPFTDQSTPIPPSSGAVKSWSWDFNSDGVTDNTTQNPTYTYPSPGTYTASLTVTDLNGCKDSVSHVVNLYPRPVVDFTYTPACYGYGISFSDNSSISSPDTNVSWNWTFGEGTSASNNQNPVYTYATTTNASQNTQYSVQLIVTSNHNCKDSVTHNVTVYALPIASFTSDSACFNLPSHLTDASNGNGNTLAAYNWDVNNDNVPDLNGPSVSFTFPAYGNNAVNYTVTTQPITGLTCSNSVSQNVWVNPSPLPAFSFTSTCVNTPPINFDASASSIPSGSNSSFSWTYGDGSSGTGVVSSHGYATAQNYTAILTVTSDKNCADTVSHIISVFPKPSPAFNYTPSCFGFSTAFADSSYISAPGNITTWSWSFGEGNSASITQNPSYTYTTITNASQNTPYNVQVTVTSNNGCKDSLAKTIIVYAPPSVAITSDSACFHFQSHLADNSNGNGNTLTTFNWDINGDHVTDLTGSNISFVFPSYGNNLVNYTVSSTPAPGLTCSDTVSQNVWVNPSPVPVFSYTNACVNAQPTIFDATASSIPSGNNVSFSWNYGDTQTGTGSNPSHSYSSAQSYTVLLTVTSDKNCFDTVSHKITVYPKPMVNIRASHACQENPVTYTANPIAGSGNILQWKWDVNNTISSIETTGQSSLYLYNTGGSHTLTLITITDHNCYDTSQKTIYINYLPEVDFIIDSPSGCSPHCAGFTGTVPPVTSPAQLSQWAWYYYDGSSTTTNSNATQNHCFPINYSYDQSVYYNIKLVVSTDSGCVDSLVKNMTVTIYPTPKADYSISPNDGDLLVPAIDFYNQSIAYNHWWWDFGDGSPLNDSTRNPKHTYITDVAANYTSMLLVTNEYGCRDSTYREVEIKPNYALYVPNAFSPNHDGKNDTFKAVGEGIASFTMHVYDRWGNLIFTSNDLYTGWDGKVKGNLAQEDVYVWKINYKSVTEDVKQLSGTVTLLK